MNKFRLKDQRELAYATLGEGTSALVCLSGLGCDHYNYAWLAPLLAQNFKVILVDNRGMGESSDVETGYEIADLAADTIELIDGLGIDKFHLVGISMGGFIAQEMLVRHSSRTLSCALMCSTSGAGDYIPLTILSDESFSKVHQLGDYGVELAIRATVHPDLPTKNPELFDRIVKLRLAHPYRLDQVLLQNRAAANFLAKKTELSSIKTPLYILHGANDRFVNPKNAELLAREFPNATSELIEDSDHMFFLEKSDLVASKLKQFFKSHMEIL